MPYINGNYYSQDDIDTIRSKASDDEFERILISGAIVALTG